MLNSIRNLYILPQPNLRDMKITSRKEGDPGQANHRYLNQRKTRKETADEPELESTSTSGTKVNVVA